MPKRRTLISLSIVVVLLAALYQNLGHDLIFVLAGAGRKVQSVSEFPFQCRRVNDPNLQACEDMWLDEKSRQLFLACSDPVARNSWMPNMGLFNVSGRSLSDHIVAMDIDKPRGTSYDYRIVRPTNYPDTRDKSRLYLVGLTGASSDDGTIQLWLVNNKPYINSTTGEFADNAKTGANSTIEVFETTPLATEMKHLYTFVDEEISTPNNVAVAKDGTFYFTNDHGVDRTGYAHALSPYIGTGTISACTPFSDGSSQTGGDAATSPFSHPPTCKTLSYSYRFPNGLHLSRTDDLLYVPSAATGNIFVFRPSSRGSPTDHRLTLVHKIRLPYPIDNISEDANGDMYAAVFPKAMEMLKTFDAPPGSFTPPSAIFRIRRLQGQPKGKYAYQVDKVIEDDKGQVLPASTTAVHDAKTGRLFLSSVVSPFITVCEKV